MKIVIADAIELTEAAKAKLRELGAILYEDMPKNDAEIIERIKDADIMTPYYIDIPASVIDQAPVLKYIIVPAVGHEWVDSAHAASKGITTLNCPTFNGMAVAELAISLLMAVKRNILASTADLRAGHWRNKPFIGTETHGQKLGLIGYGRIGQKIEVMALGLGLDVAHSNSSSTPAEVDELISNSDVVCLCLPLTDNTHHILDERRIGLLQQHTIVINVGRGATIDQKALLNALKNNKIAGAGLDVYEDEVMGGEPTSEMIELASLPNVVATPHIGYNTAESLERLGDELIANIEACLAGKPINVVAAP